MKEQDFLIALQEDILDTEASLTAETQLSDLEEWDSLSYVSFLAFAKMHGINVEKADVKASKTVGDLWQLMNR